MIDIEFYLKMHTIIAVASCLFHVSFISYILVICVKS